MSWSNSFKQRDKSQFIKFWEKVLVDDDDKCWEWQARRNKKGYGSFYVSIGHSKSQEWLAHRMVWKMTFGEIPEGLQVCHHCDNPPCVNPSHLWLGTNRDNILDAKKKGRLAQLKGEDSPQAKLTEEKVREIRKLRKEGMTLCALGDMFNVHYSTIGYIISRKLWSHVE